MNFRNAFVFSALTIMSVFSAKADAAWLSGFVGNSFVTSPPSSFVGTIDGNVSFGVYENTSAADTTVSFTTSGGTQDVTIAGNEYGYFYQFVNAAVGKGSTIVFDIEVPDATISSIGTIAGSLFSDSGGVLSAIGNLGLGTDATVSDPLETDGAAPGSAAGTTVSPFSFSLVGQTARAIFFPDQVDQGEVSSILYFTSAKSPFFGDVLLNVPDAPGTVPVPVPSPSAFALLCIGLPGLVMLRRRRSFDGT